MIDVLVVGGGPAGLATAILADRKGLSTAVAEPRSGPVDKACGEGLMPAALARLAALGVDPPGRSLRGIRYVESGRGAEALFNGPPGRGVRRTALHEALAARAAAARIPLLPVRVEGFARDRATSRRPGSGPGIWWPPTGCTRRFAAPAAWTPRPRELPATACAATIGPRPGPIWSKCTGPGTPRPT